MAGRMINGAAALAELIRPAADAGEFGTQRALPVLPELSNLLPYRGLRRGSTIAIGIAPGASLHRDALPTRTTSPPSAGSRDLGEFGRGGRRSSPRAASVSTAGQVGEQGAPAIGSGSTSLLLALLAAASSAGSWCAVVGVPTLGALAAAESGIALDRLALVPNPGPEWPTVVAALIDGVDVVVIAAPGMVSASIAGRLAARARQRGCVLVPYGRWDGADVTLQVTQGRWEGLGTGHGRLRRRKVTVVARGRGTAARPKEITMWMPGLAAAPPRDPAPGNPGPSRFRPIAVPSLPAAAQHTRPSLWPPHPDDGSSPADSGPGATVIPLNPATTSPGGSDFGSRVVAAAGAASSGGSGSGQGVVVRFGGRVAGVGGVAGGGCA
jgi:hypothetical protein